MRAIAISMVIIVHSTQLVPPKSNLDQLLLEGSRGVQLFFVISGFTLMLSLERESGTRLNWTEFWIRRIFRIGPPFWIATLLWFFLTGGSPHYWAPEGSGTGALLATILLMNIWFPQMHSAIVPGGWSISAEANLYALFPFIKPLLTSWKKGLLLLFVCMALAAGLSFIFLKATLPFSSSPNLLKSFLNSYWLPVCMPSFISGMTAFVFLKTSYCKHGVAVAIALVCLSAFIFLAFSHLPLKAVIVAPLFGLLTVSAGTLLAGKALPSPLTYLGKFSYSAYFWHFVIIYILEKFLPNTIDRMRQGDAGWIIVLLFVFVATFALSSCTYFLLEKPSIALGKRISSSIRG